MRKTLFLILIPFLLFAYRVEIREWKKGQSFYTFLKENKIPISLYYNLDKKTQKALRFISAKQDIFLLKDGDKIKQALIPINDKKQLQIVKRGDTYFAKIVPIQYEIEQKFVSIKIKNFLSYDIYRTTKNPFLAGKIVDIFNDRINFRFLPKNTEIEVYYRIKNRLGKVSNIDILYAKIANRYYQIEAYKYKDGRYYDSNGKSLKGMFLTYPMRFTKISSRFGMRFHPILHKWRMHDGIDFVNKIGTPIHSVADGRVIYKGWLGGYGKTIKIKHKNGYVTLYAHLHKYAKIRKGEYISQGTIIGYMGNTGLSTGPHLHFGVMHYGRWINPIKIKKSAKIQLYGAKKKDFLAYTEKLKNRIYQNYKVALR